MSDADHVEMEREERNEFLGTGGTGVLSLSTPEAEPPAAVPVSYGYDPADEVFYFRISVTTDDDPGELADRPVTFVAYGRDEEEGRWSSVVARGRLEDVEEAGIETATLAEMERIDIPLIDVFDEPLRMVSFDFFRLDPDEFAGRTESLVND